MNSASGSTSLSNTLEWSITGAEEGDPGSVEWFIVDHAFQQPYDFDPSPPPYPRLLRSTAVQTLSIFLILYVCRRSNLPDRIGGGKGEGGAESYDTRKPGPLLNIQ